MESVVHVEVEARFSRRDPKTNPEPGDRLQSQWDTREVIEVSSQRPRFVKFRSVMRGLTSSVTLGAWRVWAHNADVLNVLVGIPR